MRYLVINEKRVDTFVNEFETVEEAVSWAADRWATMCAADRKSTKAFYVLKSANADPDAENHFDGDVIQTYK